MAYMNQERKAAIAPIVKRILQKYNVKGTLSVRHHSTLVLNIKSGRIDFFKSLVGDNKYCNGKDMQVNPYWYHEHFSGNALRFLKEIFAAMNKGNHNNSDIQTDYFDVGWYVDVNIGGWNKPYEVERVQ